MIRLPAETPGWREAYDLAYSMVYHDTWLPSGSRPHITVKRSRTGLWMLGWTNARVWLGNNTAVAS